MSRIAVVPLPTRLYASIVRRLLKVLGARDAVGGSPMSAFISMIPVATSGENDPKVAMNMLDSMPNVR